jgi:hypothetical protein
MIGYLRLPLSSRALADAGATVIVPARSPDKAQKAIGGWRNVEVETLDLIDPASIDEFAERFLQKHRELHLLINNAGFINHALERDPRGYEAQFATNHLGHFHLTGRLWPALAKGARVVTVSSMGHKVGQVDFDDINFERGPFNDYVAYRRFSSRTSSSSSGGNGQVRPARRVRFRYLLTVPWAKPRLRAPDASHLPFAKVAKAHWGAVDGSNEYADCDTAVIFGLPFRDAVTWPTNVFFALQGVRGDDWLDNPTWNGHVNLREHMLRRQLSASIIQAINRICCRHVTDDHGGCPPADVFIVLPSGERGEDILGAIRREMPRLQVVDWPFDPDGPKVHRQKAGTPHERLLTFMGNRAPGRTSMQVIARELSLTPSAKKELQKNLRNENHRTTLGLRAMGVTYVASKGRGGKSELVKAA